MFMLNSLKGAAPTSSAKPRPAYEPRLTVTWQPRWQAFQESLSAYLSSAKAPKDVFPSAYLRDTYVRPYVPSRAMGVSVLSHIAVIFILSLPIWHFTQPHSGLTVPRIELTWTEPAADLPPLNYPGEISQPSAPRATLRAPSRPSPPGQPNRPLPSAGATAYHPRQTILSTPQHVTHPRQTLIRPQSSPQPPKIVPQLPNIVEWQGTKSPKLQFRTNPGARPKRPKAAAPAAGAPPPVVASDVNTPLTIAPSPIVNMQPKLPMPTSEAPQLIPQAKAEPVPAPEISNKNAEPQQLNINPNDAENVELKMPTSPNATPRAARRRAASESAPPDLGPSSAAKESDNRNLIALSPTPAPPAPPPKVPEGNLSARVAISPEGPQPGVPGGAPGGPAGATGNRGGGQGAMGGTASSSGTKPALTAPTVSSGASKPAPTTAKGGTAGTKPGPGSGGSAAGPGTVSISGGAGAGSSASVSGAESRPHPAVAKAPEAPKPPPEPVNPVHVQPKLGMDRIEAAATPEQILGSKRVYTIYVNMPNLTSAAGSWVLNFAELQTDEQQMRPESGDISSPVPVRKVDPKYPPTLRNENVEGEVVLYAIIRRDGSVDSIQLLKGVEPELDQNAMEALARWRFRPATRGGVPVELEAVVHIPFRNSPS